MTSILSSASLLLLRCLSFDDSGDNKFWKSELRYFRTVKILEEKERGKKESFEVIIMFPHDFVSWQVHLEIELDHTGLLRLRKLA